MRGNSSLPLASFFLLLCLTAPSFAQSQTTGDIAGSVSDQARAVIVAAEIIVTSHATHQERKTTSNGDGYFVVPLLPPGSYQVTISCNGFQRFVFDNVVVAITETTHIDAQ